MLCNSLKESFVVRLFISFAVLGLIILFSLSTLYIWHECANVRKNLITQGKTYADLLAEGSRIGVFAENPDLMEDIVHAVMEHEEVLGVSIYTNKNKTLIDKLKKSPWVKAGGTATADVIESFPKPADGHISEVIEKDDVIYIVSSVIIKSFGIGDDGFYFDKKDVKTENVIGYVKVMLDKRILSQEIQSIIINSFIVFSVFLSLLAISVYMLSGRITRPITALTSAVRLYGKGGPVEKVPVSSMDEIGRLSLAFNTMADDLKKRADEKQELEEKLRHARKMEAVGRLAGGIAHDFNNILATIQGAVHICVKKTDDESPITPYLSRIQNSLSRSKELVRSLLVFSRTQKIELRPVSINNVIKKMGPMIEDLIGKEIELKMLFSENALDVMANPLQFEQVIMNLCVNARDAMPDGGLLLIKTESIVLDAGAEGQGHFRKPGNYALISVTDTGMGMDEETKESIFEPFFTTKEVGKGTGLGLSIVYGIVEQHRGYIDVYSKKDEETVFSIYIPLIEDNRDNLSNKGTI